MTPARQSQMPFEERRREHVAEVFRFLPEALQRITWSREQIDALREAKLRRLLKHAKAHSPWHTRRLASIDPDSVTEADLVRIPPMTKRDLMENWDEIVTDRRLTLELCERQLAELTSPAYLLDEFQVVASGGSSGTRGVFAYGWEDFAHAYASYARWVARARPAMGSGDAASRAVLVMISGGSPTHIGSALGATFASEVIDTRYLAVSQPLAEIVDALNREQPSSLFAPASILYLLAAEASAGRLRIEPRLVASAFEPLFPEIADAIDRAWNPVLLNAYGTSDFGPAGFSCTERAGIHLSDDLVIAEPAGEDGRPVLPGETAPRYFATALQQYTLPIIRYEMTDEIALTEEPCRCGSSFRRIADIQGRQDDLFRYPNDVVIHPSVFRTPLGRARGVLEYRVRQLASGADIEVRTAGEVDLQLLSAEIARGLTRAGLQKPRVNLRTVSEIERVGPSRKLKRFVPLSGCGANTEPNL